MKYKYDLVTKWHSLQTKQIYFERFEKICEISVTKWHFLSVAYGERLTLAMLEVLVAYGERSARRDAWGISRLRREILQIYTNQTNKVWKNVLRKRSEQAKDNW